MTHDELLNKLNNLPDVIGLAEFKVRHDALLAVVELHKPDSDNNCYCQEDTSEAYGSAPNCYPCETIQAIEEQLK